MIIIQSSGLCPSNAKEVVFKNQAGPWSEEKDIELTKELEEAGIEIHKYDFLRDKGEVKTQVRGNLFNWSFERAWYYWMASGPGIPPQYANKLHEQHGSDVRVNGDCSCPSPKQMRGFAVGNYHVDTQEGLNALAKTLRQIVEDAK